MGLDNQMTKLAAGDMSAFDEIYRETKGAVYYIALSVVRERMLAEDVMQNCYLKVIGNASRYRSGSNALAWIAKIARNEALNMTKKRSREYSVDEREQAAIFGTQDHGDYGALTDLARKILSADEFSILILVAAEKYKRREVAQMLDMPIATVTWRYNRAIAKMKKVLKEER